jgi:hypothetical protein
MLKRNSSGRSVVVQYLIETKARLRTERVPNLLKPLIGLGAVTCRTAKYELPYAFSCGLCEN